MRLPCILQLYEKVHIVIQQYSLYFKHSDFNNVLYCKLNSRVLVMLSLYSNYRLVKMFLALLIEYYYFIIAKSIILQTILEYFEILYYFLSSITYMYNYLSRLKLGRIYRIDRNVLNHHETCMRTMNTRCVGCYRKGRYSGSRAANLFTNISDVLRAMPIACPSILRSNEATHHCFMFAMRYLQKAMF